MLSAYRMAVRPHARASLRRAMADARDIVDLVQVRVKRILDLAELAVPADKFERFRTLVFNEFGYEGFRKDLAALLGHGGQSSMDGNGTGRNESGKKGGAP